MPASKLTQTACELESSPARVIFDAIDAYFELHYAAQLRLISKVVANEKSFILDAHAIIEWKNYHWLKPVFLVENSLSNI